MIKNKNKYLINFLSLSGSQIVSNLLTFISFSLIARYLGVEHFGIFNYYLAFTFIIVKIIDLGFVPIVFRELSINKTDYTIFNTAFNIRILLFFLILVISNIVIFITNLKFTEILIFNFLMFSALISYKSLLIRELFDVPFKVHYKTYISALLVLLENILLLISVFIIILYKLSVVEFALFYFLVNLPSIIALYIILKNSFHLNYEFGFKRYKWLIKSSLPIYFCIISDTILMQADVVMMKQINTNYDVGLYSAVIRLVFPFLFIATAFVHNIFPKLAEKRRNNDQLVSFSIRSLIVVVTYIAIILFFKSKEIIIIVFGKQYEAAHTALEILSLSLIPLFYNYFFINYLIADNLQSKINFYSLIQLVVNITLNLLLLKYFSYNGAAIARLITILIGSATFTLITKILLKNDIRVFYIILFFILTFAVGFLINLLSLLPFLMIFTLCYFICILVSKIYKYDEIEIIKSLLVLRK